MAEASDATPSTVVPAVEKQQTGDPYREVAPVENVPAVEKPKAGEPYREVAPVESAPAVEKQKTRGPNREAATVESTPPERQTTQVACDRGSFIGKMAKVRYSPM